MNNLLHDPCIEIQAMQALGVGSFVLCTLSMLFILAGNVPVGEMVFAFGVVCLTCSLVLSLWEVLLSTKAINYILDDFDKRYR